MKIYFLSSQPCALSFNGVYFGITDRFERFAEIALSDKLFVEFTPQNSLPIRFFLTEDIRFHPPTGCDVYLLPDAIAIYAKDFPPADCTLKIIRQERFLDNLVTVFRQGRIHLSLETEKGFFIATLPPSFCECSLSFHNDLFFIQGKKMLAIYTKEGRQVFLEEIIEYTIEENMLNATLPLSDCLGRQKKCTYSLTADGCYQTQAILQQRIENNQTQEEIVSALVPYLFFENLLLRGDYAQFLCDDLQKDAEKFPAFLGEFQEIVLTKNENVLGLVYAKSSNLFQVVYYTVTMENGKITDVHR
jgi:hypothetical protein